MLNSSIPFKSSLALLSFSMIGCAEGFQPRQLGSPQALPNTATNQNPAPSGTTPTALDELVPADEASKLKFPVAVVFEGGERTGETPSGEVPLWRIVVCLEKTSEPKKGELKIKLSDLGSSPYTLKGSMQKDGKDVSFERKMDELTVSFDYETSLVDDRFGSTRFIYGQLKWTSQGTYAWTTATEAGDVLPEPLDVPPLSLNVFDFKWDHSVIVSVTRSDYQADGKAQYLKSTAIRVGMVGDRVRPIAACEKSESQVIVKKGEALKN